MIILLERKLENRLNAKKISNFEQWNGILSFDLTKKTCI
jgi:hypothetical protein